MTGIYKQSFSCTSKQVMQNHTNLLFVMENSSNSTFNLKWNVFHYFWKSSKLYESFLETESSSASSKGSHFNKKPCSFALNFSSLENIITAQLFKTSRAISIDYSFRNNCLNFRRSSANFYHQ